MLLCLHRFKKLHDLVREPVVAQAVLRAAVRVVVRVVLWAVVRVLVRVVVRVVLWAVVRVLVRVLVRVVVQRVVVQRVVVRVVVQRVVVQRVVVLWAVVRVVVQRVVVLWAVVRVVVQRVVVRRVVVVVRLRGYIVCFLKSSGVTVPVLLPIRHERRRKLKTAEIVSYSLSWKPCMARVFRRSNVMRVNSLTRSFIIGTFRTGNCRYSIGHS